MEHDENISISAPDSLQITVAPTSALDEPTKDEIVALCIRAFNEQEFLELFDLVKRAIRPTHVMARLDGRLVGHAIWQTREVYLQDGTTLETAYVDAVATDPAMQGRGIGSAVIDRLTREIAAYDVGCLSTHRVSFYARMGWELWTGPKGVKTDHGVEITLGHNVMIWRTPRTPSLDLDSLLVVTPRSGEPW